MSNLKLPANEYCHFSHQWYIRICSVFLTAIAIWIGVCSSTQPLHAQSDPIVCMPPNNGGGASAEWNQLRNTLSSFGYQVIITTNPAATNCDVYINFPGHNAANGSTLSWVRSGHGHVQIGDWGPDYIPNGAVPSSGGTVQTVNLNPSHPLVLCANATSWSTRGYWAYGLPSTDWVGYALSSDPSWATVGGRSKALVTRQDQAGRLVYIGWNVYGSLASPQDLAILKNAILWSGEFSTLCPPVANNDAASTTEDTAIVIAVLANDFGIDGNLDPTTVNVTSGPANGGTSVHPTTGEITYTPDPGYFGSDSFDYEVCGFDNQCDTATVSLSIAASLRDRMSESLASFSYDSDETENGATLGTLHIDFDFYYNSGDPLQNIFFEVTRADNSFLQTHDGTGAGGVGSYLSIANTDLPDVVSPSLNVFEETETLTVLFDVGVSGVPWSLNFEMYGVEVSGVQAASRVALASFRLDSTMVELESVSQEQTVLEPTIFLPVVGQ
ncbi:MAG: Ig-like domain-containing protein [Chloroflexota bacterium]